MGTSQTSCESHVRTLQPKAAPTAVCKTMQVCATPSLAPQLRDPPPSVNTQQKPAEKTDYPTLFDESKDVLNTAFSRLLGCPKGNGETDEAQASRLAFFQLISSVLQAKAELEFIVLTCKENG